MSIAMGYENLPGADQRQINFEEVEKSLLYFATSIFGMNTEKEILWDLAKNCISQLGFVDCVVYLIDENKAALIQIAAYGPKNPKDFHLHQPINIPLGEGITGHVAKTGQPIIVGDTSNDNRYIIDDATRFSEIAVPIIYENKVLGVIDSEHPQKYFFTQQHLRILTSVASLCANKIIKARAEDEMRQNHRKLIDLERQLADLKLKAIKTQMNPHFIFNSLNAIQHFITINDKKSALGYLSNFSKFIRIILKNSSADWVLLYEEHKMLYHYLELQVLRYDGKFSYSLQVDASLDMDNQKVSPSIIQQFVESRLTHGLLPKQGKGKIDILLSCEDDNVKCTLFDNGVKSITPWHMVEIDHQSWHSDYESLLQRINLLNESKALNVSVNIAEKYEGDIDAYGTITTITFNRA